MSPKGLKAPPALAATTMLMQAAATNAGVASTHGHDDRAHDECGGQVVDHRRKAKRQQTRQPECAAKDRRRAISPARSLSKTRRSSMVFT